MESKQISNEELKQILEIIREKDTADIVDIGIKFCDCPSKIFKAIEILKRHGDIYEPSGKGQYAVTTKKEKEKTIVCPYCKGKGKVGGGNNV